MLDRDAKLECNEGGVIETPVGGLSSRAVRRWMPAVLASLLCIPGAQAAEYFIAPSAALSTQYNDNILMSAQPHDSVWGWDLIPQLRIGRRTEVSSTILAVRGDLRRYSASSLNTDDTKVDFSTSYRDELNHWHLDASDVRDTTLNSELLTTGIIGARTRRTSSRISPSWTHQLTQKDSLQLEYSINDVSYDAPPTQYAGYRYQSLDASWIRQWDQRTQVSATVLGTRYEAPDVHSRTDTVGIQVGATRTFTERMKGSISVGWRSSKNHVLIPFFLNPSILISSDTSSNGALVSVSLDRKFERTEASVGYARSLTPGSAGSLYQSDQLSLTMTHHYTPTVDLVLHALAIRNSSTQRGVALSSRNYYGINPSIRWHLTERWRLDMGYRYRWQKRSDQTVSTASNALLASIRYEWPRKSVSR